MPNEYAHVRAAFHTIALALMEWTPCPLVTPREYRRLEGLRHTWTPYDPQGETEPFNVDADWEETA